MNTIASVEQQCKFVEETWDNIRYLNNPCEQVQLAAIQKSGGQAIEYIMHPTEAAQLAAVRLESDLIRHIQNPTMSVLNYVFAKYNASILNAHPVLPEWMQLNLIKRGYNISRIKEPTELTRQKFFNKMVFEQA